MHVRESAYVCMINDKAKANSLENITCSELGKQNIQGKNVYYTRNDEFYLFVIFILAQSFLTKMVYKMGRELILGRSLPV